MPGNTPTHKPQTSRRHRVDQNPVLATATTPADYRPESLAKDPWFIAECRFWRENAMNPERATRFAEELTKAEKSGKIRFSVLNPTLQHFVQRCFLPITGLRALLASPNQFRAWQITPTSLTIAGFDGIKPLVIRTSSSAKVPNLVSEPTRRILTIPISLSCETLPGCGAALVKRLLIGHPLHPFIKATTISDGKKIDTIASERVALGESPIILRFTQQEARRLGQICSCMGLNKLLYVAPTGAGKTDFLNSLVKDRASRGLSKLVVITSDRNDLTNQLYANFLAQRDKGNFEIVRLDSSVSRQTLLDLVAQVETLGRPTLLISNVQSLRSRLLGRHGAKLIAAMKGKLDSVLFDEGHHAVGPQTVELLELLGSLDKNTLIAGTTATPFISSGDVQGFFTNVFWAYLDTVEHWKPRQTRPLEQVLEQYGRAIDSGDLPPLGSLHIVDPYSFSPEPNQSVFERQVGTANVKYSIRPSLMPTVAQKVAPLLNSVSCAMVNISSLAQAGQFVAAVSPLAKKRVAAFHSDIPQEERAAILSALRSGNSDLGAVVSVGMLVEGMDFPRLETFVDLNRTVGPRMFLQRIGRLMRLHPGKDEVTATMLVDVNPDTVLDTITLLDMALKGRLAGNGNNTVAADVQAPLKGSASRRQVAPERREMQLFKERLETRLLQQAPLAVRMAKRIIQFFKLDPKSRPSQLCGSYRYIFRHHLASAEAEELKRLLPPKVLRQLLAFVDYNQFPLRNRIVHLRGSVAQRVNKLYAHEKRLPNLEVEPQLFRSLHSALARSVIEGRGNFVTRNLRSDLRSDLLNGDFRAAQYSNHVKVWPIERLREEIERVQIVVNVLASHNELGADASHIAEIAYPGERDRRKVDLVQELLSIREATVNAKPLSTKASGRAAIDAHAYSIGSSEPLLGLALITAAGPIVQYFDSLQLAAERRERLPYARDLKVWQMVLCGYSKEEIATAFSIGRARVYQIPLQSQSRIRNLYLWARRTWKFQQAGRRYLRERQLAGDFLHACDQAAGEFQYERV